MELNVPLHEGQPVQGLQHKYGDTALLFPSAGQTCHAYCTYCFRWPQFVGMEDLKFSAKQPEQFHAYIKEHKEISDVLFTGGDPMIMSTRRLRDYIEPFLGPGFEHIRQIRIGTKAPAYWPQRFVTDPDSDDLMRLIGQIRKANKLPAIMAHFSHPAEMAPRIARRAIRRLQDAGAIIRTQAPLIRHVNDSPTIWERLWSQQVRLGCIPYYMFIERDTGAKNYFEVPLAEALDIFRGAFHSITGLARTVRGPSMSATPGKINVDGVTEINGEKYFSLSFLRARNPHWVRQPFLAKYSETATWITDLKPAFENSFFFDDDMARSLQNASAEALRATRVSEPD